jgi:hypothetical protein
LFRQRNIGREDEVGCEGIFIRDVDEPVRSSKVKITGHSDGQLLEIFFASFDCHDR